MRFVRNLVFAAPVALAVALAGCQTTGPTAQSAAARTAATHSSKSRPPAQTNVVMGVGY